MLHQAHRFPLLGGFCALLFCARVPTMRSMQNIENNLPPPPHEPPPCHHPANHVKSVMNRHAYLINHTRNDKMMRSCQEHS